MLFSKRTLLLGLAACVTLTISWLTAAAQEDVSYPAFDQRCTESQIKRNLKVLNYPDRTDFVSLALRVCTKQADTTLAKFLRSPNSDLRSLAAYAWALTHTDSQRAIPALIASLKDGNASIRSRSAYALGEVFRAKDLSPQSRPAVPKHVMRALTLALKDSNKRVRSRAATSLVKLDQSFPELAPILVGALEDEDSPLRSTAAAGLGRVGKDYPTLTPAFVSALVAASRDRDAGVRAIAVQVLTETGKNPAEVVPALRVALKDKDETVRLRAVQAFRHFGSAGSAAIPDLIATLKEPPGVGGPSAATSALVRIGPASVPALIEALKDENACLWAIAALGGLGKNSRPSVPALRALMGDEAFGKEAAKSIRRIANEAEEVLTVLIDALQDQNPIVRSHAADGLVFLEGSSRAVPHLIATLKNSNSDLRAEAVLTLGRTGAPAIPALLAALHDPNVRVSSGAALAFWRMANARGYALNPNNTLETVVAALRALLNNPDERLRYRAILALRDLQPDANDLPQIPAAALRDEDKSVRARAAFELIGTDPNLTAEIVSILLAAFNNRSAFDPTYSLSTIGKSAVPYLIAALKDPERRIRVRAARELSGMGQGSQAAVPSLIAALEDKDRYVRMAAAHALAEIARVTGVDISDATPAFILALKTWDEDDLHALTYGFEEIGVDAVPALGSALKNDNKEVRLFAVDVFSRMGKDAKAAVPFLIGALRDPDPTIRLAVLKALGKAAHGRSESLDLRTVGEDPTAIPSLIQALEDENQEVRFEVAQLLRQVAAYGVGDLTRALDDKSVNVRKGAAFALGNVKSLPANAVEALKTIAENKKEDFEVRRVAASTLDRHGVDMRSFFQRHNLIEPKYALCPSIHLGQHAYTYDFDDYGGRCINVGGIGYDSGGASLFDYIKKLFGGK